MFANCTHSWHCSIDRPELPIATAKLDLKVINALLTLAMTVAQRKQLRVLSKLLRQWCEPLIKQITFQMRSYLVGVGHSANLPLNPNKSRIEHSAPDYDRRTVKLAELGSKNVSITDSLAGCCCN